MTANDPIEVNASVIRALAARILALEEVAHGTSNDPDIVASPNALHVYHHSDSGPRIAVSFERNSRGVNITASVSGARSPREAGLLLEQARDEVYRRVENVASAAPASTSDSSDGPAVIVLEHHTKPAGTSDPAPTPPKRAKRP